MKKQRRSNWHKRLIFIVITVAGFMFAANFVAKAQTKKFKPGDRIECDWLQNGTFDAGTVVPFTSTDIDQSGRWYRVKLDKDKIPNSTVECMTTRMRLPAAEEEKNGDAKNNDADTNQNQGNKDNTTNNKSPDKNNTAKYKPGDRVECDKAQIGVWEKGTVVHYLPQDTDRESYLRVKLDGYKLYPEGHQCMVNFIRPLGGAGLKAGGKYKVGDAVEAQNHNGSWLSAKIIAVDGAFYKVHFDDRDSRYDETIDEERIRPIGTAEQEENKQNKTEKINPNTGGAVPHSLPGTAWKIDYGRGLTGDVFRFCQPSSKGWEIVPARAGSIGAVGKSYTVSGSTLTTVNKDDGMVQKWKMSWEGDVLVINDGRQTLKLHYNGETQCK